MQETLTTTHSMYWGVSQVSSANLIGTLFTNTPSHLVREGVQRTAIIHYVYEWGRHPLTYASSQFDPRTRYRLGSSVGVAPTKNHVDPPVGRLPQT